MGISTYNPETGEWTDESGKDDYNRSSYDRYGPEIGNRQPERPQIDPRGITQPGLQIITPTIEKKRDEWHPGLMRTPVAPSRPAVKKPVFH